MKINKLNNQQRHFYQFVSVSSVVQLCLCHSEETMSHDGQHLVTTDSFHTQLYGVHFTAAGHAKHVTHLVLHICTGNVVIITSFTETCCSDYVQLKFDNQ